MKAYQFYQRFVKNKDLSVNFFIKNTLNKTQSMFHYKNLPPTIPESELENILQTKGYCIVTDVNGDLYALCGGLGGEQNAYYKPTQITVANPYLNITKVYTIENDKDGVLFKNDYFCNGLLPIIGKYAVLLTDSQISLNCAAVLSRLTALISASDDKTKQSADLFLEKLLNGDFSIIGENAFLKGVNLQQTNNQNSQIITHLIEVTQYYKSNLLSEIGLNSNYNMKRERLSENEVLLNSDEILPFVENMFLCRQNAVNRINEKYGTNIEVDLHGVWKTEHENNEKSTELVETNSDIDIENKNTESTENNENVTRETENTESTESTESTENESETEKIVKVIRELNENELENEKNKEND